MVLLVLGLGVLAFGPNVELGLRNAFNFDFKAFLTFNQLGYLPHLVIAGLICFCWLLLDYLYGQLQKS